MEASSPVPAITVEYFGGRHASGIIGALYTGGAAGSFLGPKLAGDAFDALDPTQFQLPSARRAPLSQSSS